MNNKGFAITTILFGITLLFCLLLMSLLGILSTYWSNMEKLVEGVDGSTGARNLAIKREIRNNSNARFGSEQDIVNYIRSTNKGGLYCLNDKSKPNYCNYYSSAGKVGTKLN